MSEIKFLKALGDEVERAAAARIAGRRGRIRRRLAIGGLGLVIAVGGAAAAPAIFNDPEQLAAGSVDCHERAEREQTFRAGPLLSGSALSAAGRSPVEACAEVLGTDSPLVACDAGGYVAVFPGSDQTCARVGMAPLPRGYDAARAKVAAFSRRVMAIEDGADCIPPHQLGRRIQQLLDRSQWTRWRVDVRLDLDLDRGPCGWASSLGGSGQRAVVLSAENRIVFVTRGLRRSTAALVEGEDSIGQRLWADAWKRCYDEAGLRALAGERFASTGRAIEFTRWEPPDGVEVGVSGPDGQPKQEGCATFAGVGPAEDGVGIVVEIDP